jgi:hypothetical protein
LGKNIDISGILFRRITLIRFVIQILSP